MNNKCVFTICTYSYLGLARTLKESFLNYNEGFDFYIVIIDENQLVDDDTLSAEAIMANYISQEKYLEMAFKYNVTEFSTSIKPFCFNYFFKKNYKQCVYLDPDIIFFSEFEELNASQKVFLTPHILSMQGINNVGTDISVLRNGIYNCGFIAFGISETSLRFIEWWGERMLEYAYADLENGYATDQIWANYVPAFFEQSDIKIIRNMGCNFAPWNFSERKIKFYNNQYYVVPRNDNTNMECKLVFMHASRYNYWELANGNIDNFQNLKGERDIDPLLLIYGRCLDANKTKEYIYHKYKYGYYSDGKAIKQSHRNVFSSFVFDGVDVGNPFDANGRFYSFLLKKKMFGQNNDVNRSSNIVAPVADVGIKHKLMSVFMRFINRILGWDKTQVALSGLHKYSRIDNYSRLFRGKNDFK